MAERQLIQLGLLAANEPGSIAIGPFGSRMKAELYVATGVPIIRGTNISSGSSWKGDWVYVPEAFAAEIPNCLTRPGDLVFPHRGSIGEVALVPDDGITYMISTSLMKFRPDTRRVSPEFLLHFFRSSKGRAEILRFASQVGTPGIGQPLTSLRQFQVDLPPLPIQRAIAATLGSLNDKIELNRRMNETLEAMARAIFQDWFVTFGPTRAKMEGRPPYLAPDLWSLFPDRLDAEGKPEGWELRRVGDFAELRGGKQLEKERIASVGTIPVFGGAGVMGFTDQHNAEGFVISVGRVGAYCGQFFSHRGKAWINNNASLIRQFEGISGEWLFQSLRHADIEVIKKGAAQPFVSNTDVGNMPIIWPGEGVVGRFADIAIPMMSRMEHNDAEASILAATRDLLLPRLMSGELRVHDFQDNLQRAE